MANWYTADTHFGDDGIRRFFQRPFRSMAAMDAAMVDAIAARMSHEDDLVEIEDGGQTFVLCHYPLLTWNNVRDGAVNLFGHVHTNWPGADNQVNVGVDLWSFAPMQAGDLLRRAVSLPENVWWQEVEGFLGSPPNRSMTVSGTRIL